MPLLPRSILMGIATFLLLCAVIFTPQKAAASPFGQGLFGADVPFGSATSIAIALGGNVSLNLVPSGAQFSGTGSHTVTVTSTDVVGYMLYARPTTSTDMTIAGGGAVIAASSNSSAAALAEGTWGYNTTGSTTNFLGMPAGGALLKDAIGPYKNGDPTTVTYGALTSASQAADTYTTAITYTVVAKNP